MKTSTKPDLQTVLSRRRRSDRQFFEEKLSVGFTKQQIIEEVEQSYSLSPESLKVLETLVELELATKKSKEKITVDSDSLNTTITTQEESTSSEENDNESTEEEIQQPSKTSTKKSKQPKQLPDSD